MKVKQKLKYIAFLAALFFLFSASETRASSSVRVTFNDGYIQYVDYATSSVHIKLTTNGLHYGFSFLNAKNLAARVQSKRPNAFRNWPAINTYNLGVKIQLHCGWYMLHIPFWQDHANPIDVTWTEIT